MVGLRMVRTAAVVAGTVGGLAGVAYGLLNQQARLAEATIGEPEGPPRNADGVYRPDGSGPLGPAPEALRFAVFGDSSAAGLGVDLASQLPGVLLARGLAEEADRPVELTTYAISGSTTPDLVDQVNKALAAPPAVALVIIGANDVTAQLSIRASAALLAGQIRRLRAAGVAVVVGTCPDLGAIRPIPQPLRSVARAWSLLLARAQRAAVLKAGAVPVALAEVLSPEFLARPGDLFSADRFHPNAAGYEAAAAVLLAPLCTTAGIGSAWTAKPAEVVEPAEVEPALGLATVTPLRPVPGPSLAG